MLLVLSFCEGNFRRSVEEYRRRFPNRVSPHRETTFSNVERQARETGKFFSSTQERVIAIRAQDEELILNTIEDEPHISTRNVSRQTGISQTSVHRVIRRNLLHLYHIQKVQGLLPEDLVKRNFSKIPSRIYLTRCHYNSDWNIGLRMMEHRLILYPNKWIGRGNNCPQVWPPQSPDLNKCDFFLWGTLKEFEYSSPVQWNKNVMSLETISGYWKE
ncbi:hypothetical protein NQ318_017271 [Aromia moschata]|uniref:DUF4817 domain-containing protein n=1 Tax=Aromia moschata TaxID=1265417 RepID=A0AAV8X6J3_9CUCU|nr:hypothetical protein NQ318_017271 [Aromia moschata]